jgi:pimeloyl-ACP methyl ester carboxylesterase
MSKPLPTVALVHGCTQGPSSWDRVRSYLTDCGIRTLIVDLDPRRFDGANGLECAAQITWALEGHDSVILVGTSCTGLIIPLVSMARPIDHLVFVCAGLPDIGRSATDQIFGDALLHEDWMGYLDTHEILQAARTFMFNDCEGAILDWALTTVRVWMPQPAYDEVTPLEAWPDIPSTYILGTRDRIINQAWARPAATSRLGRAPVELDTGHCPQNSRPDVLAKLLKQITLQGI